MLRRLLFALGLLLLALPAQAQTVLPPNTPFAVSADHVDNARPAVFFRCWADNAQVGGNLPLSARVNGVVRCPYPGLPAGVHTLEISAVDALMVSARSAPLSVTAGTVTPPPPPPPPPPQPGTSPDCTSVPPASSIVSADGATWTIGTANAILRNGVQAANGGGSILLWSAGAINVLGTDGLTWWQWNGSAWNSVGTTRPGCITVPPPPPPPPPPATLSLSCPAALTRVATASTGIAVTYSAPTSAGGTAPVVIKSTPVSGSVFVVGTTTVQATATDAKSQTASCSFPVTVTFTAPPPPTTTGCIDYTFSDTTVYPVGTVHTWPKNKVNFQTLITAGWETKGKGPGPTASGTCR